MDKPQPIMVNNLRVKQGVKRKLSAVEGGRSCFYCFQTGQFKPDCPTKSADRDPNREGGPLFMTDVNTAPGSKRSKMAKTTAINTMKSVVADGKPRSLEYSLLILKLILFRLSLLPPRKSTEIKD